MAKDANPQDLNDATDLDTLINGVDMEALDPAMRSLIEAALAKTKTLEAQLEAKVAQKKEREPKTLIERLNAARSGDPKGINLAAIQYANESDESEAVLDSYCALLEATPGVVVDRNELQMEPHTMQWFIRLYNADPVRALVPEKPAKDAPAVVADDENDDD
jgi:hypothetical protein